MTAGIFA